MRTTLSVIAICASLTIFAQPAAATAIIQEGWDLGADGWSLDSGAFIDCSYPTVGCSLALAPACCSTSTDASKELDVPVTEPTTVSISFAADQVLGDTDGVMAIHLGNGDTIRVSLSEVVTPNNIIDLCTDSSGLCVPFSAHGVSWQELTLVISPTLGTVTAESGGAIALPIVGGPTTIQSIEFYAVQWTPFLPGTFHFDNLVIATG
jgi:hypothetical protein